jgi:hypothetical protein
MTKIALTTEDIKVKMYQAIRSADANTFETLVDDSLKTL